METTALQTIHSLLFIFLVIGAFLWVSVALRAKKERQTGTWNGPNDWNS